MAKILIIGGTGSFGYAFASRYYDEHELTVFSRDELKQHEMRLKLPNIQYEIGDIRDRGRVADVVKGHDFIFQAAALKQVPSCEFFPMEAVKTNILGTSHVLDAVTPSQRVVCLSTDKAVYPINAMGTSKAMMEKVAISKGAVITRYGNVMKSRGSVIPIWQDLAKKGLELPLTNPKMTRFLLSLDDSIDLVMFALENGNSGDVFVKKAPACTMQDLAVAISDNIRIVGTRHGEKLHEALLSSEEMARAVDEGDYYRVPADQRDLNYDNYFVDGTNTATYEPYTSENTHQLGVNEIKELLRGLETVRD